eukprot:449914-Hanusia_phi.AAC.1
MPLMSKQAGLPRRRAGQMVVRGTWATCSLGKIEVLLSAFVAVPDLVDMFAGRAKGESNLQIESSNLRINHHHHSENNSPLMQENFAYRKRELEETKKQLEESRARVSCAACVTQSAAMMMINDGDGVMVMTVCNEVGRDEAFDDNQTKRKVVHQDASLSFSPVGSVRYDDKSKLKIDRS